MIRILLTHRPPGAYGYISEAWLNAALSSGLQAQRWDGSDAMWRSFQPDLYIGCSGHRQPIPANRTVRVATHVNAYCSENLGVNESHDAIDWVLRQVPDAVFGYGQAIHARYWEYWTSRHGIAWVPMATAADLTAYRDAGDARDLDWAYVGGFWPYKGKRIAEFLPAITSLKHEIRGWGDWPSHFGKVNGIDDAAKVSLYNRCKVVPCISEDHSIKYGIDMPERAFKAILCGALAIHDAVADVRSYLPSMVVVSNPQELLVACKKYCSNEVERKELVGQQQQEVRRAHTYHHRLAELLRVVARGNERFLKAADQVEAAVARF